MALIQLVNLFKLAGYIVFFSILGPMCIMLGLSGFRKVGMHYTAKTFITGTSAKIVGAIVLVLGVLFSAAGISLLLNHIIQ